jgi:hypothetical protein
MNTTNNTIKLEAQKWSVNNIITYRHKKLANIIVEETFKWATWTWSGTTEDLEYEVNLLNDIDLHGDQEHPLNPDWELYTAIPGDHTIHWQSAVTERKWNNALEKNDYHFHETLEYLGYEYSDSETYLSATPDILEEILIPHPTDRIRVDLDYNRPEYEQYPEQELLIDLLADNYNRKTQDYLVREHLRDNYQIELPQEYIHEITINSDTKSIRIHHYEIDDKLNTIVSQNNSNSPRVYEQGLDTTRKLADALAQTR